MQITLVKYTVQGLTLFRHFTLLRNIKFADRGMQGMVTDN